MDWLYHRIVFELKIFKYVRIGSDWDWLKTNSFDPLFTPSLIQNFISRKIQVLKNKNRKGVQLHVFLTMINYMWIINEFKQPLIYLWEFNNYIYMNCTFDLNRYLGPTRAMDTQWRRSIMIDEFYAFRNRPPNDQKKLRHIKLQRRRTVIIGFMLQNITNTNISLPSLSLLVGHKP